MKIVKFCQGDRRRFGVLSGTVVYPIPDGALPAGTKLLSSESIEALRGQGDGALAAPLPLAGLRLEAPVEAPEKIICIGLNYKRHAAELSLPIPTVPVVFAKFPNTLWGHDVPLAMPTMDPKIDYEAELAVVIGRDGRDIKAKDAYEHVLGYTCANDLSARTIQMATSQWTMGKNLDGFLPMGPALVTAEDIEDPHALSITCTVNGEVRQSSNTGDMIFSIPQLVAYLSKNMTLKAGDIILTGTPEGVAMGQANPPWLRSGDRVSVAIQALGELHTDLL